MSPMRKLLLLLCLAFAVPYAAADEIDRFCFVDLYGKFADRIRTRANYFTSEWATDMRRQGKAVDLVEAKYHLKDGFCEEEKNSMRMELEDLTEGFYRCMASATPSKKDREETIHKIADDFFGEEKKAKRIRCARDVYQTLPKELFDVDSPAESCKRTVSYLNEVRKNCRRRLD